MPFEHDKSHFFEWLFLFFVAFRFCTQKSHFVFAKLRFWFCRDYVRKIFYVASIFGRAAGRGNRPPVGTFSLSQMSSAKAERI